MNKSCSTCSHWQVSADYRSLIWEFNPPVAEDYEDCDVTNAAKEYWTERESVFNAGCAVSEGRQSREQKKELIAEQCLKYEPASEAHLKQMEDRRTRVLAWVEEITSKAYA